MGTVESCIHLQGVSNVCSAEMQQCATSMKVLIVISDKQLCNQSESDRVSQGFARLSQAIVHHIWRGKTWYLYKSCTMHGRCSIKSRLQSWIAYEKGGTLTRTKHESGSDSSCITSLPATPG